MSSCSKDDDDGGSITPGSEERYTGDSYQDLHSPWVKGPNQKTHVTRWECILFGSYPTNEVVSGSFNAVDDYALADGDVITDATLYSQLEQAEWTDDDMEIGGNRYHRLNGSGAVLLYWINKQEFARLRLEAIAAAFLESDGSAKQRPPVGVGGKSTSSVSI